ncbi:beta-hexosaminidase [Paraburkholderia sp. Cy-641]|uniref:beta-hexosaminidase n=1 Tax=Paraburkholderia sp. Cy-641 TaxID=2608337 RepID=UPI0014237DE6|nr:beta-hexosaminidase [Paraburkholderia sp. Cy-641]NIF81590.1 beta-hexosaminidase [Paraburkholderia sp. Cy-641]
MPRAKVTLPPDVDPRRRDTIGLHTTVKYDPMAPRPTTPIMVGKYVVARRPLQGSVHTLYMIMDGNTIVGTSISAPDEGDCAAAIARHHRAREAAGLTTRTIAKAKRKPRSARAKEVA